MSSGPFLVRQLCGPMRLPLRLATDGRLYHAIPRPTYSRFDQEAEAKAAVQRTIDGLRQAYGFELKTEEFELVPVADYEGALEASEKQAQKRKAAKKKKAEPEEETVE